MINAKNPYKFSIITVCLNAGPDLAETLRRILAQTYSNFEIIVKDGFSQDGCLENLPQDDRIRIVQQKDISIYDGMNQALDYVTGDYVFFMNCGDWFYTDQTLQQVADAMEKADSQLYYGLVYNRKEDAVIAPPPKMSEFSCFRTMICHQATVYAAELFQKKKYDTSYRILGDKEYLYHCICAEKVAPVYIDQILASYQGGGESEKPVHRERIAQEHTRILDAYFPRWKQAFFTAAYQLTFPGLRMKLVKNPRFKKIYYGVVRKLYALIPGRK